MRNIAWQMSGGNADDAPGPTAARRVDMDAPMMPAAGQHEGIEDLPRSLTRQRDAAASPQPDSASAARAIHARQRVERLQSDDSPHAFMRGDPETLRSMCEEKARADRLAIPDNTRKQDEWGCKWFKSFCDQHDTP